MSDINKNVNLNIKTKDSSSSVIKKVSSETTKLNENIKKVNESSKKLNNSIKQVGSQNTTGGITKLVGSFKGLLGVGTAILAAGTFKKLLSQANEYADSIRKLAIQTNMTTDEVQKWSYVARMNKSSLESISKGFTQLSQQALNAQRGSKSIRESFDALGVSITNENGVLRKQSDLTNDVLKALARHKNATEQAAIAQQLLGRSGRELLPTLRQGEEAITKQMNAASEYGQILDEKTIKKLEAASDASSRLETATNILKAEIISISAKPIKDLIDGWTKAAAALSDYLGKTKEEKEFDTTQSRISSFNKKIAEQFSEYNKLSIKMVEVNSRSRKFNQLMLKRAGIKSRIDDLNKLREETIKYSKQLESKITKPKEPEKPDSGEGRKKVTKKPDLGPSALDKLREEAFKKSQERYERGLQNELEMFSDYSDKQKKIDEVNNQSRINLAETFNNRLRDLNNNTLEGRIDSINKAFDDELTFYTHMLDQRIITQQQFNDISSELERAHDEQLMTEKVKTYTDGFSKVLGIASQVGSQIQSINSMLVQDELKGLDNEVDSRKKVATATIRNKKLLEHELAKIDKDAEKRRQQIAKSDRQIALIMSIINTAQGVTKAYAQEGTLGLISAIAIGAAGAIQTALIAKQAFADSGIVKGEPGKPNTGDHILVRANPKELIINEQAQQNLLNILTGKQSFAASGFNIGGDTYIVHGDLDSNAVDKIIAHKQKFLPFLRESNRELQRLGYNYAT
jgi:hypothetical protein